MTNPLTMALECQKTFVSIAAWASLTERYLVVIYYMTHVLRMTEELAWQVIRGGVGTLDIVEYKKKASTDHGEIFRFWMLINKLMPRALSSDELDFLVVKGGGEIEAILDLLDAMDQYDTSPDILKHFVRYAKAN